jgi:stage II sporulation protein D
MKIKIAAVLFLFFGAIANVGAVLNVDKDIKIGIIQNTRSFTVSAAQRFRVVDNDGKQFNFSGKRVKFDFSRNRVKSGNDSMALPVRIESPVDIAINGKHYHGSFLIVRSRKGTSVNVINVINVEKYLQGVVPKEVVETWKLDALKTQAVIARTYAIGHLGRHKADGFDLCDEPHCQVYGGADVETPSTNLAVKQTYGEVLMYDGKIAEVYYFSNSGGYTEDPLTVWGTSNFPPYLRAKKDPYSKGEPNYNWEISINVNAIRTRYNLPRITSIRTSGKTKSGAPKEIIIRHAGGSKIVPANSFRSHFGTTKIKSALITNIRKSGNNYIFSGQGFGHRVGLSQWGAKAMAQQGKSYKSILKFYYPGTSLKKVKYSK